LVLLAAAFLTSPPEIVTTDAMPVERIAQAEPDSTSPAEMLILVLLLLAVIPLPSLMA
jgi:hypothetical protein